jgi:hypothetical protein
VEFAGENLEGFAVEKEVVAFDGEAVGGRRRCGLAKCGKYCEAQDAGEDGAEDWFHGS